MSTELRDDELLAIATPPHSKITLQIAAQQKADAQNTRARLGAVPAIVEQPQVPAAASETLPAAGPDYRARYLDAIAPTGAVVGRLIKFDVKSASFITIDDDAKVDPARDFVLLADQTLIGWIKFRGEGEAPDRRQGLLYDGFVVPPRHELGDVEPTQWDDGLDGRPQDPWKHQITIVLQDRSNGELFTFSTTSKTGRRAVGIVLRHYDRVRLTHADGYPVVRLKPSRFQHSDSRIGWVNTPTFVVVGWAPKESPAKPDTSLATDMNDEIPM